ncbi:MAG: AAA family ATPase, partial [Woeseiaceae bacterium]
MDIAQTELQRQPFHPWGRPVAFVPYHAQLAAYHFLRAVMKDDRGVGVFFGPKSSGKTTIVNEFVGGLPEDTPVAVIDAARSKTLELLTSILVQFDPGPSFDSVESCWYALRVYLADKARNGETPLLVFENINQMYPSALYALCKLAELQIQGRYVVRMILMSDEAPFAVMHAPTMAAVA